MYVSVSVQMITLASRAGRGSGNTSSQRVSNQSETLVSSHVSNSIRQYNAVSSSSVIHTNTHNRRHRVTSSAATSIGQSENSPGPDTQTQVGQGLPHGTHRKTTLAHLDSHDSHAYSSDSSTSSLEAACGDRRDETAEGVPERSTRKGQFSSDWRGLDVANRKERRGQKSVWVCVYITSKFVAR